MFVVVFVQEVDDGYSGLGICAKCKVDILGGGYAFDVKVNEAIEVPGVIADEAVNWCEFFYWGLVPVCPEFVRVAPLLCGVGDHEALAVRVGEGDPEFYEVFAVVGFNIRPIPSGGGCGEWFIEFCSHFVRFDGVVDIVGAGVGALIDFTDDVCEVFNDVGMRLVREACVYAECYGLAGDLLGDGA